MSVSIIKWIAFTSMIIDHIGLFFFPQYLWFRVVGRIAFPLFAWLIANGAMHTKNIKKYFIRLVLFACISQPFYFLASKQIDPSFFQLNVIFTLALGLLGIIFLKRLHLFLSVLLLILLSLVMYFFPMDYGILGFLSIICFYLFFNRFFMLCITQIILFVLLAIQFSFPIEVFAICALPIIYFYNNRKGHVWQYFFYWIYPLQYVIFYLLVKFHVF